jgi:hypothetical protein
MKSIRYMYGPTPSVAALGENLSQALARLELPVPSLLLVLGWGRAQQRGAGRAGRPSLREPTCLPGSSGVRTTRSIQEHLRHLQKGAEQLGKGKFPQDRGKWNSRLTSSVKNFLRTSARRLSSPVAPPRQSRTPRLLLGRPSSLVNEAEHVTITQLRSSSPAQPPREFDGMRT